MKWEGGEGGLVGAGGVGTSNFIVGFSKQFVYMPLLAGAMDSSIG